MTELKPKKKTPEERVVIEEESGDVPWVIYVDGKKICSWGYMRSRDGSDGAESMRNRLVAALKDENHAE